MRVAWSRAVTVKNICQPERAWAPSGPKTIGEGAKTSYITRKRRMKRGSRGGRDQIRSVGTVESQWCEGYQKRLGGGVMTAERSQHRGAAPGGEDRVTRGCNRRPWGEEGEKGAGSSHSAQVAQQHDLRHRTPERLGSVAAPTAPPAIVQFGVNDVTVTGNTLTGLGSRHGGGWGSTCIVISFEWRHRSGPHSPTLLTGHRDRGRRPERTPISATRRSQAQIASHPDATPSAAGTPGSNRATSSVHAVPRRYRGEPYSASPC